MSSIQYLPIEHIFDNILNNFHPELERNLSRRKTTCNIADSCPNLGKWVLPSRRGSYYPIRACDKHKIPYMMHVDYTICKFNGCKNKAQYYYSQAADKTPKYCIEHRLPYVMLRFPIYINLRDFKNTLEYNPQYYLPCRLRNNT